MTAATTSIIEVRTHIAAKMYIEHMDLDVLRAECGGILLRGRNVERVFRTTRAAKSWVTKTDNRIQCERVNRILETAAIA